MNEYTEKKDGEGNNEKGKKTHTNETRKTKPCQQSMVRDIEVMCNIIHIHFE